MRVRLALLLSLLAATVAAGIDRPALPRAVPGKSELEVRRESDAWVAANPALGFIASFTDAGVTLRPSGADQKHWSWGVRGDHDGEHLSAAGNRVDYRTAMFDESWTNEERGLIHRIDVPRPAFVRGGELRLALPIEGDLRPALRNGSIEFLKGNTVIIRYGSLAVTDATGRALEARLSVDNINHAIEVIANAEGAAFPLTIIALASTTQWNVWFNAVAAAGDVNGDGYGDVIVGNAYYSNGESLEGTAMVFYGSASGISTTTPDWQIESNEAEAQYGISVSGAGDVDGDGYADVIVGCWKCSNGQANEGRAFVYHGSASGLSTSAAWSAESNVASAQFGFSVAGAGDVNRDGYGDVIVGCPACGTGGTASVYHGSGSGLALSPNQTLICSVSGAAFGTSVASADDVNGDFYSDVIVGAPHYANGQADEGAAYVCPGSSSGISPIPVFSVESGNTNAQMGISVASAGDANGDGFSDILIGAFQYTNDTAVEGRASVYYGSATGPTGTPWNVESNDLGSNFGYSVSGAGDLNGDGFGDVIIGADNYQTGGRAYIYPGSQTGLSTTPLWTSDVGNTNSGTARAVAGAGDINGDGYADAIVAVPGNGFGILYEGSGSGYAQAPDWYYEGDTGANFGLSVAGVGDVNGDGLADIMVGAPAIDTVYLFMGYGSFFGYALSSPELSITKSGGFGSSIGPAGDVNGDGYADVIVGAPSYVNGGNAVGAAFVFLGTATGLSTTATWTTFGIAASDAYGCSVAGAGDVNGDGYTDLIVGASGATSTLTAEGRAFVYHGSPNGLSTSPARALSGDQASAHFGVSVAAAGDVNGDGYSDVIVGADQFDNGQTDEGHASVYYGSAFGTASSAAWTAESDQANAHYGFSVASAGDVNGDAYDDVIVGAPHYTDTSSDEGAVFIHHGSLGGPGQGAATQLTAGIQSGNFGFSVAGAGDTNGDGYADVFIGAPNVTTIFHPNEGMLFLYAGSASGVSTPPIFSVFGVADGAKRGTSVAGAGDLNGDGFADGLAGAPGHPPNGRAFMYLGNQSVLGTQSYGRDVRPQQIRDVTYDGPVAPLGLSRNETAFDMFMNTPSPRGESGIRLQLEACPVGSPFGNAACQTFQGIWKNTSQGNAGTNLHATGLDPYKIYHWRARSLYGTNSTALGLGTPPPKPAHGPWRRLLAQWISTDVRTGTTDTPSPPTGVSATALPPNLNMIGVVWNTVPGATYQVDRKDFPIDWHTIAVTADNSLTDLSLLPDTAYAYRVRAVRAAGVSGNSIPDTALTMSLINDPLAPNMTVQALHLSQLRTAANKLRECAGIGDSTFTDSNPVDVTIKAVHITELRTAINDALTALGIPNPTYTDVSLTNVSVKAIHFQELRDRIK